MVTDAVHDLPLIVGESCCAVEVLKEVVFVMDEVMSNANHSDQKERTKRPKEIGQPGLMLWVD